MAMKYNIINGDGHIDLNPDTWRDRVAAKWRDRAPKRVTMPNGSDAVVVDGDKPNTIGITRSVGVFHGNLAKQVPTFANSAGAGPPEQRIAEQDRDGVDAEVQFSQLSAVFRQAKDDDMYLDLFRAYNEYLAEEYMAANPDRLMPMGIIPMTGVNDAVAELEHCAKLGLKGVKLDSFPSGKGYPTAADDRFWSAVVDLGMPLTSHGDGKLGRGGPSFEYAREPGPDMHQRDPFRFFFRFTNDAMKAATQMAFAGVWDRFPGLEIYWAETQIGWLEFGIWQLDDHYDRYMNMIHTLWGIPKLERKPSEYIRERNYWGFLHDPVGVRRRDDSVGAEKLVWGTDFAHAASEWPNSVSVMEKDFAGVPENDRHAMLVGNVVKFFALN
ncbi:MAG: amidohydrolase family protein [Alphaproteobacteria bacterium]|nr:amidohydrolase family protein [Alphaproteobacteria bacterium]